MRDSKSRPAGTSPSVLKQKWANLTLKNQSSPANSKRNRRLLFASLLVLAMTSGLSNAWAAQVPWTGQVVDIRSRQPVANVEVWGGFRGRVDATIASSITGGEGRFNVIYANGLADIWSVDVYGYYMLTSTYIADGDLYFVSWQISDYPSETTVPMVPRKAYIRGVVRDKASGQPLPNATVHLGVPGAQWQSLQTDAQGGYQFLTPAYEWGQADFESGIPTAKQLPHETWQQVVPRTNYWLAVVAPGYKTLNTADLPLQINLLSSTSPELHTFITLEVVANSDVVNTPSASTAIKNPYTEGPTLAIARAVKVSFATRTGVQYQLQRSGSAQGPWENVGAPFAGDGATVDRYFDAELTQARFYRAEILTP
jgi:hypothetical protein